MKRILVLVLILIALLSGCTKADSTLPAITLMAGEEALIYSVHMIQWRGESQDDIKDFVHIYEDHANFKAPFITRGSDIIMDFGDTPPDEVRVTDDIVTTEGKFMFLTRETDYPECDYTGGTLTITVRRHGTSGRTCGFMEEGRDYRGYRVYATFGEDTCAYTFIVLSES